MIVLMNGNTIAQQLVAVEQFSLEECFHKDIMKSAIDVPEVLSVGCVRQEDGSWLDAEGVAVEIPVVEEPVVEAEEAPEEAPAEAPAEAPVEAPAEEPAEEPAEAPAEE
jgi:hypothetical protein